MAIVELRNDSCSGIMGNHYHTWSLDTQVEPAIRNVIPSNAVLTSVVLVVEAYHTWTSILGNNANIDIAAWFCPENNTDDAYNSGTNLISSTRFTNDKTWATYKSGNIVGHFQTTYPFNINTSQSRLSVYFKSNNAISRTYYHRVYFDIQYTIHEHSYTSTVTTAATCTTNGVRTYTCSCGHSYTETIPALGHSYVDTVTPPTCTAQGYTTHVCSRCGHSYTDTYVAALGHNYVETNVVQPSGTSPGYTEYTCSNGCGGSELRDYTNSISVKAGTGCSQITVDGVEPTTEGATRNFVFGQNSVFTLYSYPKTGYIFEKWIIRDANSSVTEDMRQNLPVTLSSNISVEAIYKRITYTATFLNGDGSVLETVTVAHGEIPQCSKTPKKATTTENAFDWDTSNPWTPAISVALENQVYTPNFIEEYFVYWCKEDGTAMSRSNALEYGSTVTPPNAPVKQGYIFDGWYDADGNKWTESTIITRTIRFTARYRLAVPEITSVTITRSTDLAKVTIDTPVEAGAKYIISVEVI